MIEIVKGGAMTLVMDAGRRGYQQYGVPVGGAMDAFLYRLANVLLGNDGDEAALELTLSGPSVRVHETNAFVLTGFFPATLDGEPIAPNRVYIARAGSLITIGMAQRGARGYLAFSGGLAGSPVLGSRSTYTKGGFGGVEGRALREGDKIGFCAPQVLLQNLERRVYEGGFGPAYSAAPQLRVILGPQDDAFSPEGIDAFLSGSYAVTADSDRMGYRLQGPEIAYAPGRDGNIISDGIANGAVQVPSGQPIVLLADSQTVGGYAKIAGVITADLPLLAQLRPGDTVRFSRCDVRTAHRLYMRRLMEFRALEDSIERPDDLD